MGFLNKITIKARLIVLVCFASILMIIIGILGLNGMDRLGVSLSSVYKNRLVPTGQMGTIIGLMRDNRTQLLLGFQHDPGNSLSAMHNHSLEKHTGRVATNIKEISRVWDDYMADDMGAEERVLADRFAKTRKAFVVDGLKPTREALIAGDYHLANKILLEKVNTLFQPANVDVEKLLQYQLTHAKSLETEAHQEHVLLRNIYLVLLVGGITLSSLFAFFTIRGMGIAVSDLQAGTNSLSQGDLTARIRYTGNDELGQIASSFNTMSERFHSVISGLATATDQMATAAEQTASVTEQTTEGLQRQQSETIQVATAMNQMNATVQEVAHNAQNAASAAKEADAASHLGKRVVEETIDTINNLASGVENAAGVIQVLEQESNEIGNVLDVIRGIADQTNLLALNAAIEAARAGEQGRGFAVVADEVRTLAGRTQKSTGEINEMITKLQSGANNAVAAMQTGTQQAQVSVKQAAEAGSSLDSITQSVTQINDMNIQIANAAEEQTAVAEEINRNITNISSVADQTAEGARQTNQASDQVAMLSEKLRGTVAQFKI